MLTTFHTLLNTLAQFERNYFENRAVEEGENGWSGDEYDEFYYEKKLELDPADPEIKEKRRQIVQKGLDRATSDRGREALEQILDQVPDPVPVLDLVLDPIYSTP